jgi:uncharacterized protein YggE
MQALYWLFCGFLTFPQKTRIVVKVVDMKRCFFAFVLALVFTASSCVTVRKETLSERVITVNGSGQVSLAPDRASISLSVVTRNADASAAAEENARKMTAVQDALKALGVDAAAVSTSNYTVTREFVYKDGASIPGDYRVTNRVNVAVKDLDAVGRLIDAAIKAGANEMTQLSYSSSNTEAAVKEARSLAVKQAQEAARLLAENAGARLGRVISLTEAAGSMPAPRPLVKAMNAEAAVEDALTPVSANDSTVTVTIEARFELK